MRFVEFTDFTTKNRVAIDTDGGIVVREVDEGETAIVAGGHSTLVDSTYDAVMQELHFDIAEAAAPLQTLEPQRPENLPE